MTTSNLKDRNRFLVVKSLILKSVYYHLFTILRLLRASSSRRCNRRHRTACCQSFELEKHLKLVRNLNLPTWLYLLPCPVLDELLVDLVVGFEEIIEPLKGEE